MSHNIPVPAPARETTIPEHVRTAWYVVAQYVGIPGETARRQLGVLDLARIAFVSKDALDALADAVKPIQAAFDAESVDITNADWTPRTIDVDTIELRALLDCIHTLTDSQP